MKPREFLKLLMDRAGDNPNSLSSKSKVPQPTIFRFLNGTAKEPRLSTMTPIAKVYGVPVEVFFSESAMKAELEKMGPERYVREDSAVYDGPKVAERNWPFEKFSAADIWRLPPEDILEIENFALWKIAGSTGGGSKKRA